MCVVAKLQQASACNMDTTPTQPHRNVNRLQPATQIPLEPNHTETPTGFSLQHGYYSNPATPKLQHTSNQEHTTNVVIEQNSRKLLMMDILMSETCWAHKMWNKIASDMKLVFYSSFTPAVACNNWVKSWNLLGIFGICFHDMERISPGWVTLPTGKQLHCLEEWDYWINYIL